MDFMRNYKQRRRERLRKLYERHKQLRRLLKEHGGDILDSVNFQSTRKHIQHGTMTVHNHCMDVACYSLLLNKKLGLNCNMHDLIRGALLHDYFLYDWHDKEHNHRRPHGFFHASAALSNASRDFELTRIEKDIIKKHMFPLTPVPPKYKEGWVVCLADKVCSLGETIKR